MWGIIPAAGAGSRIQPLAFSKELLPVGARTGGDGERPRAVSELTSLIESSGGIVTALDVTASGADRVRVDVTCATRGCVAPVPYVWLPTTIAPVERSERPYA